MSAVATVQEAEQEAVLAKGLLETLEKRVKAGDVSVTPGQLAEARELHRFAELRIEAAEQRAAGARQEALDERGAALREQAARLADAGADELATLFCDAVSALARLARVAGERREAVREIARQASTLASEAGVDARGLRERYGVTADASVVRAAGAAVRVVSPVDVAAAVVEVALEPYDAGQAVRVVAAGRVLDAVPSIGAKLSMSGAELDAVRNLAYPTRPAVLAAMRERAADVSR